MVYLLCIELKKMGICSRIWKKKGQKLIIEEISCVLCMGQTEQSD